MKRERRDVTLVKIHRPGIAAERRAPASSKALSRLETNNFDVLARKGIEGSATRAANEHLRFRFNLSHTSLQL